MPSMNRLFYYGVEGAGALGGADLAGNIVVGAVAVKTAVRVKPAWGNGGDPCAQVRFKNGYFPEKIVRRLKHGRRIPREGARSDAYAQQKSRLNRLCVLHSGFDITISDAPRVLTLVVLHHRPRSAAAIVSAWHNLPKTRVCSLPKRANFGRF